MAGACVLVFCRWAIGLTFAISAIGKVIWMTSFRGTITELKVLPRRLTTPAAAASVTAEALTAALVAAGGVLAAAGFALATALLAIFSAVLTAALRHNADVSCHCFGPGERRISRYDLARNGLFALCCAGGLWAWLAPAAPPPGPALVVTLGLAASAFAAIAANLEDFAEVLRQPYLVS